MRDQNPDSKKSEIKHMLDQIKSARMIELIYWFVKRGYDEERAGK